jgi:hypothetical protein
MTQKCGWPNKRRGAGTVAQVLHSREKRETRLEAGRRDSVRLDFYPSAESSGPEVMSGRGLTSSQLPFCWLMEVRVRFDLFLLCWLGALLVCLPRVVVQ